MEEWEREWRVGSEWQVGASGEWEWEDWRTSRERERVRVSSDTRGEAWAGKSGGGRERSMGVDG